MAGKFILSDVNSQLNWQQRGSLCFRWTKEDVLLTVMDKISSLGKEGVNQNQAVTTLKKANLSSMVIHCSQRGMITEKASYPTTYKVR